MTSANAYAHPLALWSFRYSAFIDIQIGMRKYSAMCWFENGEFSFFYSWIFLTYSFAHTFSLENISLYTTEKHEHQTAAAATTLQKMKWQTHWTEMFIITFLLLLFRSPFPWYAIILCVIFCWSKKFHRGKMLDVFGVRPFMFDARVYLCSFFAACSFIWFLTARVHLSIKNTVDKHECLNENNEYGLPIMILRVCTLWQRVERLFFVQMKNVYKILWRWIGTKIHTYSNICTHTRTHRGAKLLDVKNKGVCALCKQKAKKCTINFVNST